MHPQLLRQMSFGKQHPGLAGELQELDHAIAHAARMQRDGRLTKQEAADVEAVVWGKYIDLLPVDDFNAMMKDGRLDALMALAGDDRSRDDYQELQQEAFRKVKADALDDAWASQKIDSKTYAELAREHVEKIGQTEDLDNRMNDGDYDGAASELFASRHDREPNHEGVLNKWLADHAQPGQAPKMTWNYERSDEINQRDEHGRDPDGFVDHDAPPRAEA